MRVAEIRVQQGFKLLEPMLVEESEVDRLVEAMLKHHNKESDYKKGEGVVPINRIMVRYQTRGHSYWWGNTTELPRSNRKNAELTPLVYHWGREVQVYPATSPPDEALTAAAGAAAE